MGISYTEFDGLGTGIIRPDLLGLFLKKSK